MPLWDLLWYLIKFWMCKQIETDVPSLGDQIKSLKDVLHDLNISETLWVLRCKIALDVFYYFFQSDSSNCLIYIVIVLMQLVRYSEIIAIPKESRTIREHILLLAYEKMLSYRNDIEALRHERDISRFTHFPFICINFYRKVFFLSGISIYYPISTWFFGALSGWCDSKGPEILAFIAQLLA